jgi:polyisoprenoid-binding protein YceI
MRARTFLITTSMITSLSGASAEAQEVAATRSPLTVSSVTVTIEGTSKRDPFLASTKTVRFTRVQLAEPQSADPLHQALRPGGLEALDVTIPVMTLTSPDKGVDEHIHRSLKADLYPDIRFQLRSIVNRPDEGAFGRLTAHGTLTIAGVGRAVALDITVVPAGRSLLVDGSTEVLMTDFGVKPPTGLLGLLKTDPLIRVRFYLVVAAARG